MTHTCKATREGDWAVFVCDLCPDYERRMNTRTGEMTVKGASADIEHEGTSIKLASLGMCSRTLN